MLARLVWLKLSENFNLSVSRILNHSSVKNASADELFRPHFDLCLVFPNPKSTAAACIPDKAISVSTAPDIGITSTGNNDSELSETSSGLVPLPQHSQAVTSQKGQTLPISQLEALLTATPQLSKPYPGSGRQKRVAFQDLKHNAKQAKLGKCSTF